MTNYTQEHLTNLLTTDREKLTRTCAEVCYGWLLEDLHPTSYFHGWYDNKAVVMDARAFNPLEDSEKGRSQAFELAYKFNCFPLKLDGMMWLCPVPNDEPAADTDPQAAIVIAAILTAQQENNDG